MKQEAVVLTSMLVCNILFTSYSQITDIKQFIDKCPTSDSNIETILNDFQIRLNGELITDFSCVEPVSSMSGQQYLMPTIILQALRVVYYMDKQMPNHLPWTELTLYEWFKSTIAGVNIIDGIVGGYCCDITDDGRYLIAVGNLDVLNRGFKTKWTGLSSTIDFLAHEVRHASGEYHHTSCCGRDNACDPLYDLYNLGAYGVQYWLNESWLNRTIDVGVEVSYSSSELSEIEKWFSDAMKGFQERFCYEEESIISSTENMQNEESISVFPNPTKSTVNIIIEPLSGYVNFKLLNVFGKSVYSHTLFDNWSTINLNLKSGMYYAVFEQNGKLIHSSKLVFY